MRQGFLLSALLACTMEQSLAQTPSAAVVVPYGFMSGNAYRALPEAGKQMYVTGVFDGLIGSPMFGANAHMVAAFKQCMEGMNNDQLQAIVDKYLNAHPEIWHYPMQVHAYNAIIDICPQLKQASEDYRKRAARGKH